MKELLRKTFPTLSRIEGEKLMALPMTVILGVALGAYCIRLFLDWLGVIRFDG
jgi:hypothetical protein